MLRWLRETTTIREDLKADLERQTRGKGDTTVMRERSAQAEEATRRDKIRRYPSRDQNGASFLSQDFAHKHVANGMKEAEATARERFQQGNVPRSTSIFNDGKKLQNEARDSQDFYARAYEAIERATHGQMGTVDNIQLRSQVSIRTVTIERDGTKSFNDAPIYYSVSRDGQGNYVINHFAGVATSKDGAFNPPSATHGTELRSVVVDGREVWYTVRT